MSNINPFHEKIFNKQIKRINKDPRFRRNNLTDIEPEIPGMFVTFTSFLRFVSNKLAHSKFYKNVHWMRIIDRCHPCEINYTAVANTETADEDSKEFIKYIYDSGLISKSPEEIGEFPKAYGSRKVENSTQVTKTKNHNNLNHEQLVKQSGNVSDRISGIKNYYKKYVPVEVMKQVYKYYYWDFELFGYGIDEYYVS